MDASARVTMKDAANCDKRRDWQNSENQENAERILRFQVIPGSMPASGRQRWNALKGAIFRLGIEAAGERCCVSVKASPIDTLRIVSALKYISFRLVGVFPHTWW